MKIYCHSSVVLLVNCKWSNLIQVQLYNLHHTLLKCAYSLLHAKHYTLQCTLNYVHYNVHLTMCSTMLTEKCKVHYTLNNHHNEDTTLNYVHYTLKAIQMDTTIFYITFFSRCAF